MTSDFERMMTVSIRRADFPAHRRILMVSDIHGHADGLRALLQQANFGENDILVIVGDYVDKGSQSLQTIRYVMELCERYTVYPMMGNVDHWRLRSLLSDDPAIQQDIVQFTLKGRKWWPGTFLDELCAEVGVRLEETTDTQTLFPLLREHFHREFSFLRSLPTILETQKFIFVHGGIPHERLQELEGVPAHPLMKWDHFMQEGLRFQKYVVVGHWPVTLYSEKFPCFNPIIDRECHIISLDGGCGVKNDGQLNLVSLPDWQSEDFTYTTWSPLPEITALDAQDGTDDCGYIRWGDHQVDVLERGNGLARVLHHGREMTVPQNLLWESQGQWYCDDVTDRRLPVLPGDRLRLTAVTPLGCYVQKEGFAGWYTGRYQTKE